MDKINDSNNLKNTLKILTVVFFVGISLPFLILKPLLKQTQKSIVYQETMDFLSKNTEAKNIVGEIQKATLSDASFEQNDAEGNASLKIQIIGSKSDAEVLVKAIKHNSEWLLDRIDLRQDSNTELVSLLSTDSVKFGEQDSKESAVKKFTANNTLEKSLFEAQEKKQTTDDFLAVLLQSKVFVMIDKEIGDDGVWDNSISPMMLTNKKGELRVALFTSPERSDGWVDRFPKFGWGLLTDFSWFVQRIGDETGIVINPGSPLGCEIEPHIVHQLKKRTSEK